MLICVWTRQKRDSKFEILGNDMNGQAGKGSKRRPTNEKTFGDNYDRIKYRQTIKELLTVVLPCNAQDPTITTEECPVDHKGCCGRCEIVHRARKILETL